MRLGHPNVVILSQMLKFVPHIQGNKIDFCTACKFRKMHQFTFDAFQNKTKKYFEIVDSDLWGSSPHLSSEGYKYYIHFVDEFTRFTWIFPLKTKSKDFFQSYTVSNFCRKTI